MIVRLLGIILMSILSAHMDNLGPKEGTALRIRQKRENQKRLTNPLNPLISDFFSEQKSLIEDFFGQGIGKNRQIFKISFFVCFYWF